VLSQIIYSTHKLEYTFQILSCVVERFLVTADTLRHADTNLVRHRIEGPLEQVTLQNVWPLQAVSRL